MIKVSTLWIVNEQGELLMAQRSLDKLRDPGVWGPSVTGTVEPGESFEQTLLREADEELGLKPESYKPYFLFEKEYAHPDGELRLFSMYYTVLSKQITDSITVDPVEVAGVEWFTIDDVRSKLQASFETLVPSARQIWPEVIDILEKV